MLLMMLERGEPIHSVVFFDTGWEFPQMHKHLDKLEEHTGIKIVRLKPKKPFSYWLFEREVVARKGSNRGNVHRIGNGWPSPSRRWCTRQKVDALDKFTKAIDNPYQCIGYAADEAHRTEAKTLKAKQFCEFRFPLIEWDVDEAQALAYCRRHGFDWGGLYDHFRRVSCFCCPLKRLGELRTLRRNFPDQWATMLEWDAKMPGHNRGFKDYDTVHDLEARFAEEDRQLTLPGVVA
jgi:3'-phosphoadenosine 5'-phosphosulfate sulfotransferase (PAPS reductase)/FAD synthetase